MQTITANTATVNTLSYLPVRLQVPRASICPSDQGNIDMRTIRHYAKTPKAWKALTRPDLLGRRAHTLLLMANGRRSEQELSLLLGGNVSELAHSLRTQGYLRGNDPTVRTLNEDTAVDA